MALTRPNSSQVNTRITAFSDPITVLNQGSTTANVDVGFLFNRANGLISNVALYWSESAQSIITAFTSNTGVTNSNIAVLSYAPITVGNVITTNGVFWANGVVYSSSAGGGAAAAGTLTGTTLNSTVVTSSLTSVGTLATLTVSGNIVYGTVPILINSSTTSSIGTAPKAIDTFATATYRGAKYLISTTDITNSQYQMAEITLTQDSANVGISVYGVSYTGTSSRMTFAANISAGALTLWGTGVSANNTVKLVRTLIPV